MPPTGDSYPHHAAHTAPQTAAYAAPQPNYQQAQPTAPINPGPQPPKKPGAMKSFWLAFAGAALACVIGIGGFAIWQSASGSGSSTSSQTQIGSTTSSTINAADQDLTLPEAVAQKALPSVAAIDVYTKQSTSSMFGYGSSSSDSSSLTESSLGSGVVLSKDGYIVTNYHVIEGADALKVTIEGTEYDADVVGSDASSDLAVIKATNADNLTPIELGDSDSLIIGEWVMTIGSPFGLEQSVATGIVSATSRSQIMDSSTTQGGTGETTIYPNMIQTDAAINPGNSGGALVDSDGKLIGINTLITSYSGNYSGVGFAIPVNYAVNIAQQIIDGKTPTHAQLGVSLSTVNSTIAQRYGLATDTGAYVAQVQSGSGAASAGLEVGDIITKFDGKAVESASDLMLDVRSKNPGDKVTLEVNRNGEVKSVDVTLGSDESSQTASSQKSSASSMLDRLLGNGSSSNSSSVS